jgi:hypothetical protein
MAEPMYTAIDYSLQWHCNTLEQKNIITKLIYKVKKYTCKLDTFMGTFKATVSSTNLNPFIERNKIAQPCKSQVVLVHTVKAYGGRVAKLN